MGKKNIMILFLSTLKSDSPELEYRGYSNGREIKVKGKQTNEAPTRFILDCLGKEQILEKIYVLKTEKAEKEIVQSERMSTYDFFEQQLNTYCEVQEYKKPVLQPIDYDEKAKGEAAFESIFKMVSKIQNDGYSKDTNVYVDMTGGLRNSTMLLLSIMRLLQYSEIHVEQVLYSNMITKEIEDVTSTYEVYDVIAGAQEFAQFGSVKTLSQYYEGKDRSKNLRDLLDRMNQFSENLKLCKANEFQSCLKELRMSIQAFKESHSRENTSEKLFEILLTRIERDYKEIIDENVPIPVIIKWCAERGFIQQALTLYTELIPVYLVDYKIIMPRTQKEEQFCKDNGAKYQPWQVYFINTFITVCQDDEKSQLNQAETIIKRFGRGEEITVEDDNIKKILRELEIFNHPEKICYEKLQSERMKMLIDELYEKYKSSLRGARCLSRAEYIREKLTLEKTCNQIVGPILRELLGLKENIISGNCSHSEKAQRMVESEYVTISRSKKAQIAKSLENYYDIKQT